MFSIRSLKVKAGMVFLLVPLLILAACGANGNSGGEGNKGKLIVASKLDVEAQLMASMYTQLLQKAGYTVEEKPALGNSAIIFEAITSNKIDIYPEFTATGLNKLNIPSSYDPKKDYETVKKGFKDQYKLDWLEAAPLNDGYALCMGKDTAAKLGISTLSDLAGKTKDLILTAPSDSIEFIDSLAKTYKTLSTKDFKELKTVDYAIGFQSVESNKSQVTVCYGTDATVQKSGMIFLKDDKNGFPAFNPGPVVREDILKKYSDIPSILNPMAQHLTTEASIDLQTKVDAKSKEGMSKSQAIRTVAREFLQSKGLL
ncbi:osmoprotectant transport system substrate-binding protein [Thermosporothrix hazakensis]|jgi:osmoprotectant transport system substrate-binding protein|uniref:Osmoprotectant transport system substrate-binding protein n=2 Tax=Thermosporothrix TaxID=768650 RepID=A0A326UDS9_THEHA|nr:glycine betaine ABC transporter substrate-binding protein [Thermosporothrix hazakensis]PZW32894.1 osmoprotectant transport system substrate-binding protein [Thermosporothrix hazakensis]BBH90875.1 glycine/betaine ABC transporter substrate-binding protein [Thermosporothrix sp. COM3]